MNSILGRNIFHFCKLSLKPPTVLINHNEKRLYRRWVAPTLRELQKRKNKMPPQPPTRRSTFIEWNLDAEIFAFGKRLNEEFDNKLLRQAFTHRSYILQEEVKQREAGIENPEVNIPDNRELIKIGEKCITEEIKQFLKTNLREYPEEGLSAIHDYLISNEVLSDISFNLGTKDIILSGEFPPDNLTLANTIKAIIGALHECLGQQRATDFVKDFIVTYLNGKDISTIWKIEKPFELLQKMLADQNRGEPEPRIVAEAGKNTILAVYQVGIYSDKKLIAIGSGESIPVAVDIAARESLRKLTKTADNMLPFKFNIPQAKSQFM